MGMVKKTKLMKFMDNIKVKTIKNLDIDAKIGQGLKVTK